jgi:hypothetical protein
MPGLANCQVGGQNMATPDACMTPVPSPAGPVPTPMPYPNMAAIPAAMPPSAALMVLISGGPAHNMNTQVPMSSGDNAGLYMGVLSGMVMGACRHMMGSIGVFIMGSPATTMSSPVGQNGVSLNALGNTLLPSQFRVFIGK